MFFTYTYFIVFLGTFLIGITAGAVGVFVYFRKESLIGDVLSHASLPGIILMYIITLEKDNTILLLGAIMSGFLSMMMVRLLERYTFLDKDSILGSTLALFSGTGIALLTYVQKIPKSSQAGLWNYIFGNAASLLYNDVILIAIVSVVILFLLIIFWKEFKLIVFDKNLAKSIDFPVEKLEIILILMIGATIMIGLQSVGIVLMSSLIVAPVATAKLWSKNFFRVVLLSIFLGGIYCLSGTFFSIFYFKIPVGPAIVLSASTGFLLSLILKLIFNHYRGWSIRI